MKKIIISSAIVLGFFAACKTGKQSTESTVKLDCSNMKAVTYINDIKPIMEANCTRCHNTNNKAGFNFLTIESVKEAATTGKLLGSIKYEKGYAKMPISAPKMDQAIIDKIECWIKNGMN